MSNKSDFARTRLPLEMVLSNKEFLSSLDGLALSDIESLTKTLEFRVIEMEKRLLDGDDPDNRVEFVQLMLELRKLSEAEVQRIRALYERAALEQQKPTFDRTQEARKGKRLEALARVREQHPWIVGLPLSQAVSAQRAMLVFERIVGLIALCVPKRVMDEEVGDACEVLAKHFKHSSARWPAYVKLVTTVFWIVLHAFGYAVSQLNGSKRASGE